MTFSLTFKCVQCQAFSATFCNRLLHPKLVNWSGLNRQPSHSKVTAKLRGCYTSRIVQNRGLNNSAILTIVYGNFIIYLKKGSQGLQMVWETGLLFYAFFYISWNTVTFNCMSTYRCWKKKFLYEIKILTFLPRVMFRYTLK